MTRLLIAWALLLGACTAPAAVSPASAPAEAVSRFTELRPGVSTIADAIAIMGQPKSITRLGDGGATVVWMEFEGPLHLVTVALIFGADGKLVRVGAVSRT